MTPTVFSCYAPAQRGIAKAIAAEFCSARRFLLLLEGSGQAGPRELVFGGLCSTLFCTEAAPPATGTESLRAAQAVLVNPSSGEWPEVCRFARLGRRLAREQGRIAELYELMQQWHVAAEQQFDTAVLDESSREIVWILEGWGRLDEARALEHRRIEECAEQMHFSF